MLKGVLLQATLMNGSNAEVPKLNLRRETGREFEEEGYLVQALVNIGIEVWCIVKIVCSGCS